jgi:hypothetical protein
VVCPGMEEHVCNELHGVEIGVSWSLVVWGKETTFYLKNKLKQTQKENVIYIHLCVCVYIYIYIYIYTRLLNNKDEIMLFKENKRNGNCHVK